MNRHSPNKAQIAAWRDFSTPRTQRPTPPVEATSGHISSLPGPLVYALNVSTWEGRYPSHPDRPRCMDCGALQYTPHLASCDRLEED